MTTEAEAELGHALATIVQDVVLAVKKDPDAFDTTNKNQWASLLKRMSIPDLDQLNRCFGSDTIDSVGIDRAQEGNYAGIIRSSKGHGAQTWFCRKLQPEKAETLVVLRSVSCFAGIALFGSGRT